jgi:glycerophosphoryl diester phosphodiesterase
MSMPMRYQQHGRDVRSSALRSSAVRSSAVARRLRAAALISISLLTLVTTSGCSLYPSLSDLGPLEVQPALTTLTVAHRGNISSGTLPDNSLPALRHALAAGVSFLEVDVRRSHDGALFLFHDGSFSRSNSYARSCLRGIPISQISSADRDTVTLDDAGTVRIPTLADALALLEQSANTTSTLQLDLKAESDSLALEVLELVRARRLLHRVLLQLRTPERVGVALANYPTARILARCKSHALLEQALAYKVEVVELERWITSEAVRLAHQHGVRVAINIAGSPLDEPSTHQYFRARGVDMIMTDTKW